jgi:MFS superfamily sulfate permease-like transporter
MPSLRPPSPPSWWREFVGGSVGSIVVIALILTLGLLATAPLGAAGVALGIRAALMTAVGGGLVYALLSRAALPAVTPSSATALLVAGLLLKLLADPALRGSAALPLLLALVGVVVSAAGVLQLLAGLTGLARLALYLPRPVVAGFMNGVALQVMIAQWPLLLGQPLGGVASAAGAQPGALALGLLTALAIIGLARRWPRLPGALLVMLLGTSLHALALQLWPELRLGQAVGRLPPLALLPPGVTELSPQALGKALRTHAVTLALAALLIAGVGSLETLMNGLTTDRELGTRQDPGRELVALGLTNILLGPLGGLPAVMTRARAMSVAAAGGRHRQALVFGSLALGVLALAGQSLLAWLPLPLLAGILLAVAASLVDRWTLPLLRRQLAGHADAAGRGSLTVVAAVMLTTLAAGLGAGVVLGALLSLLLFVVRMNRSLVRSRYTAAVRPSRRMRMPAVEAALQPLRRRIAVIELEGALFFGSGERLLHEADTLPDDCAALLLDAARLSTIDETGVQLLQDLQARTEARGVMLRIAGLRRSLQPLLLDLQVQTSADVDRAIEAAEDLLLADRAPVPAVIGLYETPLLQGLDDAERRALGPLLQPLQLAAGETLFEQGDAGDRLFLLLSGSVSVVTRPDAEGRSQRFLSISPGMLLGETALLDGGGRSAGAVADSDATLVALDGSALDSLEHSHPGLAASLYRRIAVHLSQRLRGAAPAWAGDPHTR